MQVLGGKQSSAAPGKCQVCRADPPCSWPDSEPELSKGCALQSETTPHQRGGFPDLLKHLPVTCSFEVSRQEYLPIFLFFPSTFQAHKNPVCLGYVFIALFHFHPQLFQTSSPLEELQKQQKEN